MTVGSELVGKVIPQNVLCPTLFSKEEVDNIVQLNWRNGNDEKIRPVVYKKNDWYRERLKTVEEVFSHFKPTVKVDFETAEGKTVSEELKFNNVGDFGKEGITSQSKFLLDVKTEQDTYHRISKQLRTNKILKSALSNPENRQAFLQAIQALMQEMDATK